MGERLSATEDFALAKAEERAIVSDDKPGWEAGIDRDTRVVMTNVLNESFFGMDYTSTLHTLSQMRKFIRELVTQEGFHQNTDLLQMSFALETPHDPAKEVFILDPLNLHEKLIVVKENRARSKTFLLTCLRGIRYGAGIYAYSVAQGLYTDEGALINVFDPVGERGADKYIEDKLNEFRTGTVTGVKHDHEGDEIYPDSK